MEDKEFNLLEKPWIKVMDRNCSVSEVSLIDVILNAHNYESLAGEMPTQDIAILRLILACLHTIFERYDLDGNESYIYEEGAVYAKYRWMELWNNKAFPAAPIIKYFEEWHDRFFLFHPERPFFQVTHVPQNKDKNDKESMIKHFNGTILESNNKKRMFCTRIGESKYVLNYSEAARWLVTLMAYDDGGLKKQGEEENKEIKKDEEKTFSVIPGWLTNFDAVYAVGKNLFETLMLNFALLDGNGNEWGLNIPVWEETNVREGQSVKIPFPNNPAALYTLQTRRVKLIRNDNFVTDLEVAVGDVVDKNLAYGYETMSNWKVDKKTSKRSFFHRKKRSEAVWRSFPQFTDKTKNNDKEKIYLENSTVTKWIRMMKQNNRHLPKSFPVLFRTVSVELGKSNGCIADVVSDNLSFDTGILQNEFKPFYDSIIEEIELINNGATVIARYASDLAVSSGAMDKRAQSDIKKANGFAKNQNAYDYGNDRYYEIVGNTFLAWFQSVYVDMDPEEYNASKSALNNELCKRILSMKDDLVMQYRKKSLIGTMVDKKLYSEPRLTNYFCAKILKLFGGNNND